MVHSFFVHTLNPESCRIIYSLAFYNPNNGDIVQDGEETADIKTRSCQVSATHLQPVANRVVGEYIFHEDCSANTAIEEDYFRAKDGDAVPDLPQGVFKTKLSWDEKEKLVLWQAGFSCAFVMIVEINENTTLAKTILSELIRVLQNKLQVLTQPSNVYLKPDAVNVIVKRIVPSGQLLFLNNRTFRAIKKEIDYKNSQ